MNNLPISVAIGDRIYDNDPRMVNRVLTITEITGDHVIAVDSSKRKFQILQKRIYTGAGWRKTGFSLMLGDKL